MKIINLLIYCPISFYKENYFPEQEPALSGFKYSYLLPTCLVFILP